MIRGGLEREIEVDELVVGDIVILTRGDKIQADGRIISGALSVDQSALNGESAEVRKCPSSDTSSELLAANTLFRGAIVTEGEGIMQVEKVGVATFYGMVATDVQAESRVSPLKLRLSRLASPRKTGVTAISWFATLATANNFQG